MAQNSRKSLDIHGHFFLPQTEKEALQQYQAFHDAKFLVSKPVHWDAESILTYLDRAGVALQMLSYVPHKLGPLQAANDYGASIVAKYPTRFGLLAALPTDNMDACLSEIVRTTSAYAVAADGFATNTVYNGVWLSDSSLEPVWQDLNKRGAVVHIHPNAYAGPAQGRPSPVIEVAFDTARTAVDMLYNGVFRRHPNIKFVLAHSGGALPVLSGRLALLGTEDWVPNPENITRAEIGEQLGRLYVDTAATASTGLAPAMKMVGVGHCIYGADCGVPCSTEATMEENRRDVLAIEEGMNGEPGKIGTNGWALFPEAAKRAGMAS